MRKPQPHDIVWINHKKYYISMAFDTHCQVTAEADYNDFKIVLYENIRFGEFKKDGEVILVGDVINPELLL
ncbi:hypothetical protein [Anaerovibrio sp.]|uniref:hypothetical protein n=1 Tax=Anaerovibrio sp. TaxID=1872532 RepID=UPI00388F0A34